MDFQKYTDDELYDELRTQRKLVTAIEDELEHRENKRHPILHDLIAAEGVTSLGFLDVASGMRSLFANNRNIRLGVSFYRNGVWRPCGFENKDAQSLFTLLFFAPHLEIRKFSYQHNGKEIEFYSKSLIHGDQNQFSYNLGDLE